MGNSSTKNEPITLTLDHQDTAENLPKDIMIMASLEQMAVKFSGLDHIVVWQDPNIKSPENISYLDKLGLISDLKVFDSWQEASSYIQELNIPCQALTSGTNGESFISTIAGSPNVKSAYVFCGNTSFHRSWAKKHPKLVVCVENDFEVILDQMKRNLIAWQRQNSSLRVDLPAFGDADVTQMNKIHYYLKSFVHFNNREQAKSDFLMLSSAVCRDKSNINAFHAEYKEYDMKKILSWYTRESFLYKIVNNCLRIASADAILYARLIIRDLELAIKERYNHQSSKFNGLLYRGTYISAQEWSNLEARIDREIEMFGFLSTTKAKGVALSFVESDIAKKALITIVVPAAPDKGEQGFAEVKDLSDYAAEDEVLFNIRSRFTVLEAKIEEINGQNYRHLVLLYGAQAMRSFVSTSNPIIEINLRNLDPTKCGDCHESIKYTSADKNTLLFVDLKRKEHYTCFKCLTKTKANKRSPHMCLSFEQVDRRIKEDSSIVRVKGMVMKYTESTTISLYRSRCKQCQSLHQIGKGVEQCQFRCLSCCNSNARWCEGCFDVEKECLKSGHEIIVEFEPFTFWSERMSAEEVGHLEHHKERQKNMASLKQAKAYFEAEDYAKAKRYYEEYLRTNNTEQTKDMANIYNNLAVVYRQTRRLTTSQRTTHQGTRNNEISIRRATLIHSRLIQQSRSCL